jgi:uncharacterized delta-60 repeat protein
MRKFSVLAASLFLVQIPLLALTLLQEKIWGGPDFDEGNEVAVAADGSTYVAGTTLSFGAGDRDAFLVKYDAAGSIVWQRTYGTAPAGGFRADEFGLGLALAGDGSAYLTGILGSGVIFLAKFDADGNLVWDRTWGENGTIANGAAVGPDGGIYLAGSSSAFGFPQSDAVLVKFTPDGDLAWARSWGGSGFDAARDVAVGADGGVYIAGETNSFFANDAFLVKFDADGNVVWERDWSVEGVQAPFTGLTAAYGVGTAPDGSVYITGNAFDTGHSKNIFLVKFDAGGTLVWEKIGGPGFGAGRDVAVGPDGAVFVSGNMFADIRDPEIFGGFGFVAEFTSDGKAKKANSYGGDPNESASAESVAVAADGTVVTAGYAGTLPYTFDRASNSAKTPDTTLTIPVGNVTSPLSAVNVPGGIVTTPDGENAPKGVQEAFMLRLER